MDLLIIGSGAAGATAAFEARKVDPEANIRIISSDRHSHYSPCGLPFAVSGQVKRVRDLIVHPPSLYAMSDIEVNLETSVKRIDPGGKMVETDLGLLAYDKLIIATGSKPLLPKVKGADKKGIFTIKGIDDGEGIVGALEASRRAVIIGAGLIGLEMAVALSKRGLAVKVVKPREGLLLSLLDGDMTGPLFEHLEWLGIELTLGSPVEEIFGGERAEGIILKGEKIMADMIIAAIGSERQIGLAKEAGAKIGPLGAIEVNAKMETSLPDIYAAGDCIEIKGAPKKSFLGSAAVREGKVAGMNAAGGDHALSPGLSTTISDLGGLKVGAVGLSSSEAERLGHRIASARLDSSSTDAFFPGGRKLAIKLIADAKTKRLIGAQIVGEEGVWGRLMALSFAMQLGASVKELAFLETAYVPSVSPTFDPVTLAADMLLRRMN
ncbi:MAG: FAD-dependent oxidoreductase [Actinomycetota bacterium]|nr:FAD-dependent oxidoreductase [Actinomycetota bacterium]